MHTHRAHDAPLAWHPALDQSDSRGNRPCRWKIRGWVLWHLHRVCCTDAMCPRCSGTTFWHKFAWGIICAWRRRVPVMEASDIHRCICVYIYMYAYIYVHIHINIYKHIHACIYVCIQTCLCTNIHVYIDIYRYE